MSGFDRPVYIPPAGPKPARKRIVERVHEEEEIPTMEDFLWSIRRPRK
jgi:hypothetical protein